MDNVTFYSDDTIQNILKEPKKIAIFCGNTAKYFIEINVQSNLRIFRVGTCLLIGLTLNAMLHRLGDQTFIDDIIAEEFTNLYKAAQLSGLNDTTINNFNSNLGNRIIKKAIENNICSSDIAHIVYYSLDQFASLDELCTIKNNFQ